MREIDTVRQSRPGDSSAYAVCSASAAHPTNSVRVLPTCLRLQVRRSRLIDHRTTTTPVYQWSILIRALSLVEILRTVPNWLIWFRTAWVLCFSSEGTVPTSCLLRFFPLMWWRYDHAQKWSSAPLFVRSRKRWSNVRTLLICMSKNSAKDSTYSTLAAVVGSAALGVQTACEVASRGGSEMGRILQRGRSQCFPICGLEVVIHDPSKVLLQTFSLSQPCAFGSDKKRTRYIPNDWTLGLENWHGSAERAIRFDDH